MCLRKKIYGMVIAMLTRQQVGKMIAHALINADMEAKELAERMGISPRTITSWKAGETCPSVIEFLEIARITKDEAMREVVDAGLSARLDERRMAFRELAGRVGNTLEKCEARLGQPQPVPSTS